MSLRTVNAKQLDVLNWIIDGCPDGVMTGYTYKTTALALQSRRLVTVSKKGGGVWRAKPTDAGRYYVEHETFPANHWATPVTGTENTATPPAVRQATPPRPPQVTRLRPVDQLLADLAAAGGELHVKRTVGRPGHYENLVSSAIRHNKVPAGKVLRADRGDRWEDQIIRLVDQPAWMTTTLEPIVIAEQLRNPHPAVKSLLEDKHRLDMKREVRSRALRILDALAKEATRRGYTVAQPAPEPGYTHPKGHLRITISGHDYTIMIDELNDRVPHEPTAKELRDKERYSWTKIPTHDAVPSGRLRLQILQGWAIRQDKFSDTKTIDLTDRLAIILQEIELRATAAEERRLQRERDEAERERQWRNALTRPKVRARDHHRAKVLTKQAEQWRTAQQLDDYLDAMTARIQTLDSADRDAAEQWLTWARDYRTRLDPLNHTLKFPDDPEYTPDVPKPFLDGWSPYTPQRTLSW